MRIARFTNGDDPRFGLVTGDVDDQGIPDEESLVTVLTGDPLYVGLQPTDEQLRLSDVRLLSPVLPRSKVVGIGKNYAAHAAEMGGEVPSSPLTFFKPNTSVIGPGEPIIYPSTTQHLSYEGELAVVIGRICREVPVERVKDVIFGYTVANDVTARDLQKSDGQWARAKGYDTFCPLGPWITTHQSLEEVGNLHLTTTLDGRVVQDGSTADMVLSVADVVAFISSYTTLLPGDVILTGTPEGVGPMLPGQEVTVTIEGIGSLTNVVATDQSGVRSGSEGKDA